MIECLTQISYFGFNKKIPNLVGAFDFYIQKILSNCSLTFCLKSIKRLIGKTTRNFSRTGQRIKKQTYL